VFSVIAVGMGCSSDIASDISVLESWRVNGGGNDRRKKEELLYSCSFAAKTVCSLFPDRLVFPCRFVSLSTGEKGGR
jgi:hypothetical protein